MRLLDRLFGANKKVMPERVRDLDAYERLVVRSDRPVIVDVWSATCAPCKKLEPVLIEVATRYEGRVRVVEIGTADCDPRLLAKLDVRATPTLIVVKDGEELGRQTGWRPVEWFAQMIDAELSG
ncbi:thioredoxin family protein [Sandaracinus amylolyticus]|uniref:thioredoxin family protein n=1 Tax=Sandaracinus amylolyticus TaxID=927083 RepID=UPI001F2AD0A5|nr:thioredoxin domain-containing protein [Sandaracinus amylolyticus]UJR84525.1 Hypothetical protein I5071_66040 [Sandaracinus amylolyticus]